MLQPRHAWAVRLPGELWCELELAGVAVPSWMSVLFPWPCSLSPVRLHGEGTGKQPGWGEGVIQGSVAGAELQAELGSL